MLIFFFFSILFLPFVLTNVAQTAAQHTRRLANIKFTPRVFWSWMANTYYPDRRIKVQVCRQEICMIKSAVQALITVVH